MSVPTGNSAGSGPGRIRQIFNRRWGIILAAGAALTLVAGVAAGAVLLSDSSNGQDSQTVAEAAPETSPPATTPTTSTPAPSVPAPSDSAESKPTPVVPKQTTPKQAPTQTAPKEPDPTPERPQVNPEEEIVAPAPVAPPPEPPKPLNPNRATIQADTLIKLTQPGDGSMIKTAEGTTLAQRDRSNFSLMLIQPDGTVKNYMADRVKKTWYREVLKNFSPAGVARDKAFMLQAAQRLYLEPLNPGPEFTRHSDVVRAGVTYHRYTETVRHQTGSAGVSYLREYDASTGLLARMQDASSPRDFIIEVSYLGPNSSERKYLTEVGFLARVKGFTEVDSKTRQPIDPKKKSAPVTPKKAKPAPPAKQQKSTPPKEAERVLRGDAVVRTVLTSANPVMNQSTQIRRIDRTAIYERNSRFTQLSIVLPSGAVDFYSTDSVRQTWTYSRSGQIEGDWGNLTPKQIRDKAIGDTSRNYASDTTLMEPLRAPSGWTKLGSTTIDGVAVNQYKFGNTTVSYDARTHLTKQMVAGGDTTAFTWAGPGDPMRTFLTPEGFKASIPAGFTQVK